MIHQYQNVEAPFNYRHICWFCGEPAGEHFSFPQADNWLINCQHPPLTLMSCAECLIPARRSKASSIWLVFDDVKRYLLKAYQKDLAIGVNWTPEELAGSEFEGGNFAGFQRSAWMMFEIAKTRVNFAGWPLIVAGICLDEFKYRDSEAFTFDGMTFPSIDDAIKHYAKVFSLNQEYVKQVLAHLGIDKFAQAVRFCRLLVGSTPDERKNALNKLLFHQV